MQLNQIGLDTEGRIRVDDWEMREDVQAEVAKLWEQINSENINEISDLEGYRKDFFNLFGFEFDDVDYNVETNELVDVPSIK
ncbi:trans-2-enoyl-CoA reductase [Myroides gitamensis]|nr:trans-2-enoyl-CoA reductase [Myroides gitamensis]